MISSQFFFFIQKGMKNLFILLIKLNTHTRTDGKYLKKKEKKK